MPEKIECILCGSSEQTALFSKASGEGTPFTLVSCGGCGLRFISPRPAEDEIGRYYGRGYFTARSERGYDNYFSPGLRREIERVMGLNLGDLGFGEFERGLHMPRYALDIGCAAGYFVGYLSARGWSAQGIDVSQDCVEFATGTLRLDVRRGDYLRTSFDKKFHLITLWATIEHLHRPDLFLEKIHEELADGGMLYISTCRSGGINFMRLFGPKWRYYNFPEHLYFFSHAQLRELLRRKGFEITAYRTYGSGMGKPGSMTRKVADFLAKRLYMGDMMLIAARRLRRGTP